MAAKHHRPMLELFLDALATLVIQVSIIMLGVYAASLGLRLGLGFWEIFLASIGLVVISLGLRFRLAPRHG